MLARRTALPVFHVEMPHFILRVPLYSQTFSGRQRHCSVIGAPDLPSIASY